MKKHLIALLLLLSCVYFVNAQNPIFYLLVGTYTNGGKSDGIYIYKYNPNKNEATPVGSAKTENPSFLAISKDQKYVYAVNENHGDNGGDVSAFALDKKKGTLTFLNKESTGGDDPCFVAVDSTGKNVVVANYSGGNLSVFKTNADGSLQPHVQLIAHEGYGVNVKRQEMPHVHCTVFSPDQKYLFAADLGNDRLYRYSFNPGDATAPLKDMDPPYYEIPDGSGPRHIVFSPDKKFAYLINEMAGNVIAYSYNNGQLTQIQTIASDITKTKEDKGSAEIDITPNGKFLYTTNRVTSNEIVAYKINSDGTLLEVGRKATGIHPRHFMIDPTGHFLLVANRDSNNIQVFIINKNYGILEDTGVTINVPSPVCLKMVPVN
ncbi:MAG TPA: lactonase family protein [Chitinophagaceae bacterium]|jgi:6-phosphogluconolactonase|nr:lactonase family protein [Chitinophagaceae bacterium]